MIMIRKSESDMEIIQGRTGCIQASCPQPDATMMPHHSDAAKTDTVLTG